jgi:hypothetical protein
VLSSTINITILYSSKIVTGKTLTNGNNIEKCIFKACHSSFSYFYFYLSSSKTHFSILLPLVSVLPVTIFEEYNIVIFIVDDST